MSTCEESALVCKSKYPENLDVSKIQLGAKEEQAKSTKTHYFIYFRYFGGLVDVLGIRKQLLKKEEKWIINLLFYTLTPKTTSPKPLYLKYIISTYFSLKKICFRIWHPIAKTLSDCLRSYGYTRKELSDLWSVWEHITVWKLRNTSFQTVVHRTLRIFRDVNQDHVAVRNWGLRVQPLDPHTCTRETQL